MPNKQISARLFDALTQIRHFHSYCLHHSFFLSIVILRLFVNKSNLIKQSTTTTTNKLNDWKSRNEKSISIMCLRRFSNALRVAKKKLLVIYFLCSHRPMEYFSPTNGVWWAFPNLNFLTFFWCFDFGCFVYGFDSFLPLLAKG